MNLCTSCIHVHVHVYMYMCICICTCTCTCTLNAFVMFCLHVTRRHGQTVCVHFMVLLIMILVQDLEVLIH